MGKFFIFSNKNISWNLFFFFVLSSVLSRPCFPLYRHCRCRIPVGIDIQTGWLTKYPFTHNFSLYPSIGYCLELVTPSSSIFLQEFGESPTRPFPRGGVPYYVLLWVLHMYPEIFVVPMLREAMSITSRIVTSKYSQTQDWALKWSLS